MVSSADATCVSVPSRRAGTRLSSSSIEKGRSRCTIRSTFHPVSRSDYVEGRSTLERYSGGARIGVEGFVVEPVQEVPDAVGIRLDHDIDVQRLAWLAMEGAGKRPNDHVHDPGIVQEPVDARQQVALLRHGRVGCGSITLFASSRPSIKRRSSA